MHFTVFESGGLWFVRNEDVKELRARDVDEALGFLQNMLAFELKRAPGYVKVELITAPSIE